MAKNKKLDFPKNPKVIKWLPDFRYRKDKTIEEEIERFKSTEQSVTDKEAYRITLASMRGVLASASGNGSITAGNYEIPAGKEYDPMTDMSFFHRPDIGIVEIDEATARLKSQLEKYDSNLKLQIQKELDYANKKRKELVNQQKEDKSQKTE